MVAELSRRTKLLLGGGLLVASLVGLIALATALGTSPKDRGPATVEEAVALDVLDQELVDEVRVSGDALGIISLDWRAIAAVLPAGVEGMANPQAIAAGRTALAEAKRRLLEALGDGVTLDRDFELLSNLAVRFHSEADLLTAVRLPLVTAVRANTVSFASVEESKRLVHQPEVWRDGHGGKGTYVAVIDEGVDPSDTTWFPAGSVAESYQAKDADDRAASEIHGTHVASTVLAMAPETRIIAVDVFSRNLLSFLLGPGASRTSILDGVQHVIALKEANRANPFVCCNVVAMNLSLGESESYYRAVCTDDYSFERAFDLGIIPVVAAGNDAEDKQHVFHPGVGTPACAAKALSVGATTDGVFGESKECEASTTVDVPTSFSQTGETLSILAPGDCIVAAGGAMQGTSMAAPHVAGAVAVLAGAKPGATPAEIWKALTATGKPITDARISPSVTANRLDIQAALQLLLSGGASPTPTPPVDVTPPVVHAPVATITAGSQLQPSGSIPVTVTWSATDETAVVAYELRMRQDGGAWVTIAGRDSLATSAAAILTPGSTYAFAVAATDRAGNRSAFVEGPQLAPAFIADGDISIEYRSGSWTELSRGEALGGSVRAASASGAEACLTVRGSAVAWVATRQPGLGRATVWLDGAQVGNVDLGVGTSPRVVAYTRPLAPEADHQLCIRVEPADSPRPVEIDGFAVLR